MQKPIWSQSQSQSQKEKKKPAIVGAQPHSGSFNTLAKAQRTSQKGQNEWKNQRWGNVQQIDVFYMQCSCYSHKLIAMVVS